MKKKRERKNKIKASKKKSRIKSVRISGKDVIFTDITNRHSWDFDFYYLVELLSSGSDRKKLIKTVSKITGLPNDASEALVDNTPAILLKNLPESDALRMKKSLEKAGGTAEIRICLLK